MSIDFELNGQSVSIDLPDTHRLSDALREHADCRDVKIGCNAGDCGLCSVLLDDEVVCACLVPLSQAAGHRIDTLKGLMESEPVTQNLADSFLRHGAAQCGICTPGLLVSATPLLRANKALCEQAAKDALGGVLCRCTGYRKMLCVTPRTLKLCLLVDLKANFRANLRDNPMGMLETHQCEWMARQKCQAWNDLVMMLHPMMLWY